MIVYEPRRSPGPSDVEKSNLPEYCRRSPDRPAVANFASPGRRGTLAKMRGIVIVACLAFAAPAAAQDPDPPTGALDPDGYVALSADQRAQLSLGGFRGFLERIREDDTDLYRLLDARLDSLEERDTIADVVFWIGTGLAVGALGAAIPVHEELGVEPAVGFIIGGVCTFVLAVIIQAIVRPGHDDLMALIDTHDQLLGRR